MVLSSVMSLKKKKEDAKAKKILKDTIFLWENTKDSFICRD